MKRTTTLTKQRNLARHLRREQTEGEHRLWNALRSRQLNGLKFRRQHPLGPYIVDFCCPEFKLAIELDGGQHALQTDADERRSRVLAHKGYRVLRFWNHEVLENLDGVLHHIVEMAKPSCFPSPQPSPHMGEGLPSLNPIQPKRGVALSQPSPRRGEGKGEGRR